MSPPQSPRLDSGRTVADAPLPPPIPSLFEGDAPLLVGGSFAGVADASAFYGGGELLSARSQLPDEASWRNAPSAYSNENVGY